ncbi:thiaminase/transcriptional activator TenA [Salibacterium salarium]|uniref:thiaminase II n=1 Tax=Salibacterium salarium TaxID=284579 RepID=UPI0027865130|nr:thiaminase II [Salibacterium salarium]MDQ0300632.1 thiaminase/transcriptional activator TenA [Salibacterium salarium]
MTFSERLYEKVKPIWEKNHNHPFVQKMGKGTLDKDKFRYFMIQDYLYLIEYAKLFAIGAVKATDVKTMGEFAKMLDTTLNTEMALHRQYAKKFNISEEELEQAKPAAVTVSYTHYMLAVGQNGGLAELVASLLPCMWSYAEIGKSLQQIPGASEHEFYGEWISMYADDEFQELAQWTINLLDQLAEEKPEHELRHLEEMFLTTTRFEYMFWDMAYHEEVWPV